MCDYICIDGVVEYVCFMKCIVVDNWFLECVCLVVMCFFLSVEGGVLVFISDVFFLDFGCC